MYIGEFNAFNRATSDTAAPTGGYWQQGDICWNETPHAGGPKGWMCVAAGEPGTWDTLTPVSTKTVTLTSAQVKALRATPISLVAAPGSGKVLKLVDAVLYLDYGSNVFTESADNLAIKYTNGSGAAASETIETTGFIDASADAIVQTTTIKDAVLVSNAALVLHNTGDGEIAGNAAADSVVKVFVTYRTITL